MQGKKVDKSAKMLLRLKILHTVIWWIYVIIIGYICYCGITDKVSTLTWVAIGLVVGEGLVLLIFKNFCPITLLARKYSDSTQDNFDIFLPNWLARYNKPIWTTIFLIGLALVIYRVL